MGKEYEVKITDYAFKQMQEIVQYLSISLHASNAAKHWLEKMKKELASLSFFPARIPLTEEDPWHSQGIHKFVVGNHLAYFWIDEDNLTVWIIAFIYGSRSQREQLSNIPF